MSTDPLLMVWGRMGQTSPTGCSGVHRGDCGKTSPRRKDCVQTPSLSALPRAQWVLEADQSPEMAGHVASYIHEVSCLVFCLIANPDAAQQERHFLWVINQPIKLGLTVFFQLASHPQESLILELQMETMKSEKFTGTMILKLGIYTTVMGQRCQRECL